MASAASIVTGWCEYHFFCSPQPRRRYPADLSLYFRSISSVQAPDGLLFSRPDLRLVRCLVLTVAADFMADGYDSTFGVGSSSMLSTFHSFRVVVRQTAAGSRRENPRGRPLAGATAERFWACGGCGRILVPSNFGPGHGATDLLHFRIALLVDIESPRRRYEDCSQG